MTELKIDNPAQRLLDILEEGKQYNTGENCRAVWKKMLHIQHNAEHHILIRLSQVMALPERIVQVRENNFPSLRGKSTHWENCVSTAFTSQNLNESWYTFFRHIDERTLFELGTLSDLFDTRGAHSTIDMNEIDSLLIRITELREEIRHSNLSSAMKTMLLKQLTQIQEALESYFISGVEPVMDAVQSTLGLAVIAPEYKEEIKSGSGSQFGDRISTLLGDVANVVTVAGALPALPVAIQSALSLLSK
ncbi:TPA: hypothetical protein ON323_003355 [Serratia marcescens]|nr:hypothetical protein [Serratia marcescens]